MTNSQLQTLILNDSPRIATAISTGAAYEIWMQVELLLLFRQANYGCAREVPYPAPNQNLCLDATAGTGDDTSAIELKVESATNAGKAFLGGVQSDITKIANYNITKTRYAVGIAYSAEARTALSQFASVAANKAIYKEASNIGVLVAAV